MIENISIDRITPHPNNPRKDLGDLTELADSIRQSGIFQNLTVIPHTIREDDANWKDSPTQANRRGYMVVIGHRRLAAAKLAGLETVPCSVVEMSDNDQIATMLLENMQRSDLTYYEQANGIQMMLDLGETVSTVSEKTGFSDTTIRKRVKLLDLDKTKFQEAELRGATLADFAELDKIKNATLKNEVLEKIGTPNFKWELERALANEKTYADREKLIEWLRSFAEEVDDSDGLFVVKRFSYYYEELPEIPKDAGRVKYFFFVDDWDITLMKESIEQETAAAIKRAEAEQERKIRYANLDRATTLARGLRFRFVKECNPKKHSNTVLKFAAETLILKTAWIDLNKFSWLMGIEIDEIGEAEEIKVQEAVAANPAKAALAAAYCSGMDQDYWRYYDLSCRYEQNERLDRIYSFLGELGYEMSDEEKGLADGTHELFVKEKKL